MNKLFNKILIPVDFSEKLVLTAEDIIDFAKQYDCSIHLISVITISALSAVSMPGGHIPIPYNADNKAQLEPRLKIIADNLFMHSGTQIQVSYSVVYGTWDHVIIDLINEENFDVVLIVQKGKPNKKIKMVVNPDSIGAKTNVPVITVPSNRRLTRLYSIIIPITDFVPVRKLMYGIYIASKFTTTLKLLGIENRNTQEKVQFYLRKSYQLIHDNSSVQVEMETVRGENVAQTINQFAMRTSADLVIVNPGTQTKMTGFLSSWLGNILQKFSAPPVMTVNPV